MRKPRPQQRTIDKPVKRSVHQYDDICQDFGLVIVWRNSCEMVCLSGGILKAGREVAPNRLRVLAEILAQQDFDDEPLSHAVGCDIPLLLLVHETPMSRHLITASAAAKAPEQLTNR